MKTTSTHKEELETITDVSLQPVTENSTGEGCVNATDKYIEGSLEKRKKDAEEPLYFKRV